MNHIVTFDSIKEPIRPSPGFEKKRLSEYKLDIMGLCGFGCRYCSSNAGNYLRINRQTFTRETKKQLKRSILPSDDPALMFIWHDVIERLEAQLDGKPRHWGEGKTLVFSMLTDGFSPYLVKHGITKKALELVLEKTSFRIRVLTKNATVGSKPWITFFDRWHDRFVIGLSTGTLNNKWAKRIEVGTSMPTARLKALHRLQDAGIATYGMLCPLFPDTLAPNYLEELIDATNPSKLETLWAEPFNDRSNWEKVRDGYSKQDLGYEWLTNVYEGRNRDAWSVYARELYERLVKHGKRHRWVHKLHYLLYEKDINALDAKKMAPFTHILLQGDKGDNGYSKNVNIKDMQRIHAVATL